MEATTNSTKAALGAALALATATPAAAAEARWTVDPDHSEVGFRIRHMMVSWTRGRFQKFQGTVVYDEAHPERSKLDVTIDAASVDTNVAKRDDHLRSPDFFDVAKFPTLSFKSKKVTPKADGQLEVLGDLTLRGVTRPVTLEVSGIGPATKDPWGSVRRGATATAQISRKDFGLHWNAAVDGGGVVLGDEVRIQLEVELIKSDKVAQGR